MIKQVIQFTTTSLGFSNQNTELVKLISIQTTLYKSIVVDQQHLLNRILINSNSIDIINSYA